MRPILLSLAAALLLAAPAAARPLHQYGSLALSADGTRVAAIETASEPDAPVAAHGAIVVRDARSGRPIATIDPCAACVYSDLAFAPAGDGLAFLSENGADGTASLMVTRGGAPRAVATLHGIAGRPRWSSDGATIALLVTIGAHKAAGATQPGAALVGEIGTDSDEQRIAVVPAAGGALRPVSPADRYVYEYDWTPDGRGFVVTSAPGNGDDNWWVATLDAVDLATGAVRQIAAPKLQIDEPRVSPDGRTIAFVGGLMSDFGSEGGDLWTVPFAGGDSTNMTPGSKATATSLLWLRGGIRMTTLAGDHAAIVAFDPTGRGATTLWQRAVTLDAGDAAVAFSADGKVAAAVVEDFEHGPAIFAGTPAALRQISHDNDAYPAAVRARSVSWRNEGFTVQGWLLTPRDADPARKAAMVTIVHGGPAAAETPTFLWKGVYKGMIDAGYTLFMPNPRGSYGQGEAFVTANKRDFGGGDLRDILAGIDAAEQAAPIDDARLGLFGGSYGGFMAMFAPTRTQRFKAAAAAAGLSDWISYYGTNGIDQWMIPFLGASAYDDPAPYRAMSAIDHIRTHRTPTFIYAGERDVEVPPTQSIEMWHALVAMGVPTSLVIYPGEGHATRDPAHIADIRRRTIGWFDRYLGPSK